MHTRSFARGRSLSLQKTVTRPEPSAEKPESEYTALGNTVPEDQVTASVKQLAINKSDLEQELANGVAKAAAAGK
jgi:hypothetical protein